MLGFRPEVQPAPATTEEVATTSPESVALSKALKRRGLRLRRADDDVCPDGGDRAGRRPPRGLPPARGDRPVTSPPMTRVHAFTDDALGHHDAVGLTEELPRARCRIPEVVEAAIARTEAVNDRLNAVAYADFDGARERAADPHGGFFAGVPTFVKDNVDVAGMPTMQGSDAWAPAPATGRRRLRPDVPRDRPAAARQDPALRVRLLAPAPSTRASGRSAARGPSTTRPVPRRPARPRWSRRARSRSPTPTTVAGRSGSRPRSTAWWGSSRPAAGWRRTR